MNKLSKRYFLFGWNDNDEWHDENDWEVGFMITGLALHAHDRKLRILCVEWDTIMLEIAGKVLSRDFQHIGVFEIENFREHSDEFRIEVDETSGLQYCRFKPRTSCIRLVKEITNCYLMERLGEWLNVFDIMSFDKYKDEYQKFIDENEKSHSVTIQPQPKECEVRSSDEDTPEEVRNQILYVIALIFIIVMIVIHFK